MCNLSNVDVKNKCIFVRVDFNVPIDDNGNITSFKRIDETVPTIDYLRKNGAKIILCSHLGRPKGQKVESLSLYPVFKYLENIYGSNVVLWANDTIGGTVDKIKSKMKSGQILLLENVRFYKQEEDCDKDFAINLAKGVDIFVDEAFAVSHRKSASNYGISQILPSYEGFLMQKEKKSLCLNDKKKPILAILGGAKVSDKIKLISNLIDKVDYIFVGGAMAFTFLKALGKNVGKSIVEDECLELAKEIMNKAKNSNVDFILPKDVVVSTSVDNENNATMKNVEDISSVDMGLDIGEQTILELKKYIEKAQTIFWNGPLGVYTNKAFENGTKQIAISLAKCSAYTIVGGGDSVDAIEKYNLEEKINFVSTGGGASLKYIQNN